MSQRALAGVRLADLRHGRAHCPSFQRAPFLRQWPPSWSPTHTLPGCASSPEAASAAREASGRAWKASTARRGSRWRMLGKAGQGRERGEKLVEAVADRPRGHPGALGQAPGRDVEGPCHEQSQGWVVEAPAERWQRHAESRLARQLCSSTSARESLETSACANGRRWPNNVLACHLEHASAEQDARAVL
jgi:hypothetical protein